MRKGSAGPCRFANTFLSPVWNRNCISNVQITFKVGWPPGVHCMRVGVACVALTLLPFRSPSPAQFWHGAAALAFAPCWQTQARGPPDRFSRRGTG